MMMLRRTLVLTAAIATVGGCGRAGSDDASRPMAKASEPAPTAPAVFRVRFETSRGAFVVESRRDWAPHGVDRFHQLVASGFFDNARFFRVIPGFVVQFGMHGDPDVARTWEPLTIPDDPVSQSNQRGAVTFATAGPNTRTTQLFINLADNSNLDGMGFAPIGTVIDGMAVVDGLYGGYGDGPPGGRGPDQPRIRREGNAYLERDFPQLDFIRTARLVTTAIDSAARGDTTR
jgi:peptidyl-prolyl cis-trans isomerase A (cyclophilin A)